MNIISYKSVGNISFGMSEEEVIAILGKPLVQRYSYNNRLEYHYKNIIISFSKENKNVCECTIFSENIKVNKIEFNWKDNLLKKLCQLDGTPYEFSGTVILFNLGIALSAFPGGSDDKTITAFCLGNWDKYKDKMKVFKI